MNYRRFCRWQQAEPHYVNRHEGEVQHCHNCGNEFEGNFCPSPTDCLLSSLFPVFDGQSLYALKVFEVRGDKCHLMVDGCSTDEQIKLIDPLACVFQ